MAGSVQDASGSSARAALGGLLAHWGERLSDSKGAAYQALHNPLSAWEGVPLLPLPRLLFTSGPPVCCIPVHETGLESDH